MEDFFNFLNNYRFYGISLYQIGLSFLILVVTLALRRFLVRGLLRVLEKATSKTVTEWDDSVLEAIRPPLNVFILAYGIILAVEVFPLPEDPVNISLFVDSLAQILVLVLMAWLLLRLVAVVDAYVKSKAADPEHWMDVSIAPVIALALKILVIILSLIVIVQNLGYSVSGLVASLGIGGVAVAFALKETLGNFFGSLMIIVDKPFKVGDWIKGSDFEGIVEEIGLRSTRLRTFGMTIENIPNNLLANVLVENMDRRKDAGLNVRRIMMTIGVTYDTTAEQMEQAVDAIRDILKNDPGVDQKMISLVYFTDFGASSLDIFLYFFSNSVKWAYYLNVRQQVNLQIMKKLEELGLSFAFPSQSVYIEKLPAGFPSPPSSPEDSTT